MDSIKIKGRKIYRNGEQVGEITGRRWTAPSYGPCGPGYGYRLVDGNECAPCYMFFNDACAAVRDHLAALA